MNRMHRCLLAIVVAVGFGACASGDHPTGPTLRPGHLVIRAITSGESRDVEYLAFIDSQPARLLPANSSLKFDSLAPGQHSLRVSGVAPNCAVDGTANQMLTIMNASTSVDTVRIVCASVAPRILYGSSRDGAYDLYVSDTNGSGPTQITTATAYHGQWSPDGSRLVYMSPRSGDHQIYVSDSDGLHETQLTSDPASHDYPQWSPDGSRIAYSVSTTTWVMNADGSDQHQIFTGGAIDAVSWSPDGNQLALGATEVFVINADGTDLRVLTNTPDHNSNAPVWSPDGTRIAFITNRDSSPGDIYLMNADGTNQVALTESPYEVYNDQIAWSPDGARLAFRSNRPDSHPNIYVMEIDGTHLKAITQSVGDNYGPTWHP